MKINLTIEFGSMADPIADQLKQHGVTIANKGKLLHIQKDADAIARLLVRGIITESTANKARQKVFLAIKKNIIEVER